ncbi:MAG: dihydrodipicolinate synthase family protein [Victivallaceae bacterium]
MIPEGIIPPVLTPLKQNQDVDFAAFRHLLDKLINGGVHALFVAGTAGFGSVLTEKQYCETIEEAVGHVAGRLPVLAGVLEPSTMRGAAYLKFLERSGVSAAVVVAPYYLRAGNETQLRRHFGRLREASDLELAVYNIPMCTGTTIPAGLLAELAGRGWISACKDSSGDPVYFAELCRAGQAHGMRVYQGMRPDFAQLAQLGASGCVPVPGNVSPELFVTAWNQRRNHATLPELQRQCDVIWERLVTAGDFFSRSLKALAEQGIGSGVMPEPFNEA